MENVASLAARLMLALLFVVEGWVKIGASPGIAAYREAHQVPALLLPLVIATELGGGLMVAAGFFTRLAAVALAGFCLLTALLFHGAIGDPDQFIQFGKNLGLAGGFLLLALRGGGDWSADGLLARRRITRR